MITRTVVEREGELLGPVDWSYDFLQHFAGWGTTDERKREMCERAVGFLRVIADASKGSTQACVNGYWKEVYAVGMYDGWPYWKPTPATRVAGVLGGEWQFFYDLEGVRAIPKGASA